MWAVAAVLFRSAGATVSPLQLNLAKGLLACIFLSAWLAYSSGGVIPELQRMQWVLLLASGAVGIGIGDTAFFSALNSLGERRTVLLAETLAPPVTVVLAYVALAETLHLTSILAIAAIVLGVACVITDQSKDHRDASEQPSKRRLLEPPARLPIRAIFLAIAAAGCQSVGAVISRQVLSGSEVGPVASSLVRLLGGLAVLVVVIPIRGDLPAMRSISRRTVAIVTLATILGTMIGIVCQQASLKYTSAGVSQTLIATSALFVIPFAFWRGETVSARAILGALVAVIGVGLLFSSKLS